MARTTQARRLEARKVVYATRHEAGMQALKELVETRKGELLTQLTTEQSQLEIYRLQGRIASLDDLIETMTKPVRDIPTGENTDG
jgi:hypothetical protein